LWYRSLGNK